MKQIPYLRRFSIVFLAVVAGQLWAWAGIAQAQSSCPGSAGMAAPACSGFGAFSDPWPSARERWWDISNAQYNAFLGLDGHQSFSYAVNPQITLTYDAAPATPYFVGYIEASGLKPNFAYQMKLLGKPVKGSNGFGAAGDDVGNERIGYVGRWWCDTQHSSQTNFDDAHYLDFYKNAPGNGNPVHDIYGYQFIGDFITDRFGHASIAVNGKNSYHITFADWQGGIRDIELPNSPFLVQGGIIQSNPTIYYGYGSTAPNTSVRLWYEYEGSGRPRSNVVLPAGTYKCRMLLTEESFHNSATNGGFWKSVLIDNDVTFAIGAPRPPANLTATPGNALVTLAWSAAQGATSYNVYRAVGSGEFVVIARAVPGSPYEDRAVTNGVTYRYRVTPVNTAGEGGPSNIATATPRDGDKPSVIITTPTAASIASLNNIVFNATDDTAIARVELFLQRQNDGKWWTGAGFGTVRTSLATVNIGNGNYQRNSGLPNTIEGRYTITANAYDAQGNAGTDRRVVSVNWAPPTVDFLSHANGDVVSTLDSVTISAEDNAGGSGVNPARVQFYVQRQSDGKWWNGSSWGLASTGLSATQTGPTTFERSTAMPGALIEGRYTMLAYAYDNLGQLGRKVITIRTPLIAPTVVLTTPRAGAIIYVNRLDAVVINAQDNVGGSGINRVQFFLQRSGDGKYWNGTQWISTPTALATQNSTGNEWRNTGPLPADATTLPNGRYILSAYAYDTAGQMGRATGSFTVQAP